MGLISFYLVYVFYLFFLTMNIMSPRFVLLVYLLGHDLIVEALFGCSYWNYKQCLYFKTQFLLVIFMHCFYCCVLSTLPVCFGSFYYLSFYSMKYHLLIKKRGKKKTSNFTSAVMPYIPNIFLYEFYNNGFIWFEKHETYGELCICSQ